MASGKGPTIQKSPSSRVAVGHAFARAGILGNPSDVYFGRVLSVVLQDFQATVTLGESSHVTIEPLAGEEDVFRDIGDLADFVRTRGYYGGGRLIKATIKVFDDYCQKEGLPIPSVGFTVRYRSSIPRHVGLAGSSAIVTATLRALMSFFEVEIPQPIQPNLVLSAEVDELGITAGLMDRVSQVFEGLVYMDLSRELMKSQGHGTYETLQPDLLPRLFLAHHPTPTKVSGLLHSRLQTRWERGDGEVRETIAQIADLATEGRDALLDGDHDTFASLMDQNFDLRRRIMSISEWDLALVFAARSLGASAKLTGSGGAIIGVVKSDEMLGRIEKELGALGAVVLEPVTA